jgi:hypothetical protein
VKISVVPTPHNVYKYPENFFIQWMTYSIHFYQLYINWKFCTYAPPAQPAPPSRGSYHPVCGSHSSRIVHAPLLGGDLICYQVPEKLLISRHTQYNSIRGGGHNTSELNGNGVKWVKRRHAKNLSPPVRIKPASTFAGWMR